MRTRTKFLTAAAATLAIGGVAIAGAGVAYSGKGGHHGGRHMGMMLEFYDADGDGKLTQVELDNGRSEQLVTFDTDGDQQLTLEEYEALWLDAMRSRMVDRFQHLDEDGDGVVTLVEYTEPMSDLVARKDRNGDGALSREDKKRYHKDRDHDRDDDGDDS
ncbi:MAG: hypothetical protein AAF495_08785 [Pseudomonadota bacterium]